MTDRIRDDQFDREIRDFLAWQAEDLVDPPTAADIATHIGSGTFTRSAGPRLAPQLVWVLLAGLLIAGLLGAVAVGSSWFLDDGVPPFNDGVLPPAVRVAEASPTSDSTTAPKPTDAAPSPTPRVAQPSPVVEDPIASAYEALFLRLDVVDGSPTVIAIGVDAAGHERQIARLPGAWVAYALRSPGGDFQAPMGAVSPSGGFLAPMGAVSPSGLLAIPTGDADLMMHWEIFDLLRPEAAPIVVPGIEQHIGQLQTPYVISDVRRPSVSWGPGERLGIPFHNCDELSCGVYAVVDGRTGLAIPGRPRVEPSCRTRDRSGSDILSATGSVVRRAPDGSREELVPPSGVKFACLAPNDSMLVYSRLASASDPEASLIDLGGGGRTEIAGSFAGWLAVDR